MILKLCLICQILMKILGTKKGNMNGTITLVSVLGFLSKGRFGIFIKSYASLVLFMF